MLAVPGATAVANPAALTVAAEVFEELPARLVMFCLLPSLYVPLAVI